MANQPSEDERRAVEVAHRLLNTPYKPHLTKKEETERAKATESKQPIEPGDKVGKD